MAIEIVWSQESLLTFNENIDYLLKRWSSKEVDRFIKQTDYILARLQEHPQSFSPSSKSRSVRRARMNKHITLYYNYSSHRKQIFLPSFWNTNQDSEKLRF